MTIILTFICYFEVSLILGGEYIVFTNQLCLLKTSRLEEGGERRPSLALNPVSKLVRSLPK
jgi:hypothetical protein